MRALRWLAPPLASVALAAGCASLDAQVYVFDESHLDPMVVLFASLPRIEAHVATSRTPGKQKAFLDLRERLATEFVDLGTRKGFAVIAKGDVPGYLAKNRQFVERALLSREADLTAAGDSLEKARQVSIEQREAKRDTVLADLRDAENHYRAADGHVYEAIAVFDGDLEALFSAYADAPAAKTEDGASKLMELAQKKAETLRELRQWVRDAREGYLARTDEFLADARTAMVVGAPDACWRAVYNKVYGGGHWGNVDIAVIKETATSSGKAAVPGGRVLPEFSLKGVRVDAGTVSRATFAGIKEALNIAALAFGLPPAPTSSGTPPAGAPAPEPDADASEHERLRVRQEVLGALDAWLLSGPTAYAGVGTAEERAAAVARLRTALDPLRATPK